MCTKLEQLRANQTTILQSYLCIVNPDIYTPQCSLCLTHIHISLITYLTVAKYQHDTTPLVCYNSPLEAAKVI